jgi:hypothetical protein
MPYVEQLMLFEYDILISLTQGIENGTLIVLELGPGVSKEGCWGLRSECGLLERRRGGLTLLLRRMLGLLTVFSVLELENAGVRKVLFDFTS